MSAQIPIRNVESASNPWFESRKKIHPRRFTGLYRRLRLAGGFALFALFFGTVWLTWGDRQAVLWDLGDRKFHIFGQTFWPQDLVLLSGILIVCAFGLFFLTVFAGRVWCGYACPQSVWTWVFMWAERVTEGDRNQRLKLDRSAMSPGKFLRRAAKHSLWLAISLVTAVTFVGYFTPVRALVSDLATLSAGGWALFWVAFFTAATYINAGWLREQVCFHMCPYGRFQSSMLDDDSLVITYDTVRGEPRGSRKKTVDSGASGLGDCVDCQMCVQVCPTGIDIRHGLQMECIGCAACIDACDSIMERMGYATGLIRYTSENALKGQPASLLRPRLLGYAAVLVAMVGLLVWGLSARPLLALDVAKDRTLFQYNGRGFIENTYLVKVVNKDQQPHRIEVSVSGLDGLELEGQTLFTVADGAIHEVPVVLAIPPSQLNSASTDIRFRIESRDGELSATEASRFTSPSP